jgi:predicted metal-dependent hydrolase
LSAEQERKRKETIRVNEANKLLKEILDEHLKWIMKQVDSYFIRIKKGGNDYDYMDSDVSYEVRDGIRTVQRMKNNTDDDKQYEKYKTDVLAYIKSINRGE